MTPGVIRGGITLAVIAAVCTTLVAATYLGTKDRIVANQKAWLERSLLPVLSGVAFDSDLTDSQLVIPPPHELPGSDTALIYRVYSGSDPAAALFVVSARGYSGPIRLLVGIDASGTVSGVRVLEHRETPGLGDLVESSKTDWIQQFNGRNLGDPELTGWAIKRDGGEFDQLTGASITPRAIVNAVRDTLLYFSTSAEQVFVAAETQTEDDT
ncbi:MAG: electron transport complex subunit RsxG [Gammaproteobacteria bacterium]|nr:electron transport complex subunit RsxG [Gammaproteobacteria bacterium]